MLRFAPDVALTVPDHPARSDLMAHFDEGYLEKSYGVHVFILSCIPDEAVKNLKFQLVLSLRWIILHD